MRKETFVAILNTLKDAKQRSEDLSNDLDDLWRKHRPGHIDFCKDSGIVFDDWELYDNMTSALANEFTYPGAIDDLNWWFYEVPMFHDSKDNAKIIVNDIEYNVYTPEELYDFMRLQEIEYLNKQDDKSNKPSFWDAMLSQ